jgi:hypothetical protein
MKTDNIEVEILADGTLKFITDPVSAANHTSAEEALRFVARLAGGETKRVRRHEHGSHSHTHTHGEEHDHSH